jgi:hypothetical protein
MQRQFLGSAWALVSAVLAVLLTAPPSAHAQEKVDDGAARFVVYDPFEVDDGAATLVYIAVAAQAQARQSIGTGPVPYLLEVANATSTAEWRAEAAKRSNVKSMLAAMRKELEALNKPLPKLDDLNPKKFPELLKKDRKDKVPLDPGGALVWLIKKLPGGEVLVVVLAIIGLGLYTGRLVKRLKRPGRP